MLEPTNVIFSIRDCCRIVTLRLVKPSKNENTLIVPLLNSHGDKVIQLQSEFLRYTTSQIPVINYP